MAGVIWQEGRNGNPKDHPNEDGWQFQAIQGKTRKKKKKAGKRKSKNGEYLAALVDWRPAARAEGEKRKK